GSQWSGDSGGGEPPFPFLEAAEIDSLQEGWGGGFGSTGEDTFTADWRKNPVTGRDRALSYADTLEPGTFAPDPEPPHRQGAKTGLNQGRVTQKRDEEDETGDFGEPELNDEDLDGFSPLALTDTVQGLGYSELFTRSEGEALGGGFLPGPGARL
ncbi:MAG: chemotaxis protein, partial [Microcystis panniformis]